MPRLPKLFTVMVQPSCHVPGRSPPLPLPSLRNGGARRGPTWLAPLVKYLDIKLSTLSTVGGARSAVNRPQDGAESRSHLITGYDGAVTECVRDGVMPGPQDQLNEPRNPDQVRPLERDATRAELRERLERLPPNHPTSPHNDDGSRKPPEPNPASRELPIPGDPDYHPEDLAADQHLATEDTPRINPDGSWEWQGYSLTPEESRCGDLAVGKCRDREGRDADGNYGEDGLTPAMRRIEAQLEHGTLAPDTEKFALKSADRFKQKLAERISLMPGESADTLAYQIHDGIRYTFIYEYETYTSGSEGTEAVLAENGFDLVTRKPSWNSPDYKGVNSQWRDAVSGLLFEVQFHTRASWEAKQATHDSYARLADPRITPKERAHLERYQQEVSASVPVPPGALEFPYYHKEGA
ncbi:MAG TPA: hypothetical protein VIX86_25885 [Streptosporangiaceae bacterium]